MWRIIILAFLVASCSPPSIAPIEKTATPEETATTSPTMTPVATIKPERETFTTDGSWNIREFANTQAEVLAVVTDAEVEVLLWRNGWYLVKYGEIKGWIYEGAKR